MTEPLTDEQQTRVAEHVRLVHEVARMKRRDYLSLGVTEDDLISYGMDGLIDAVRKDDPTRGDESTFNGFVVRCVRWAMSDGVRAGRAKEERKLGPSMRLDMPLGDDADSATLGDLLAGDLFTEDPAVDNSLLEQARDAIAQLPKHLRPVIPLLANERACKAFERETGLQDYTIRKARDEALWRLRSAVGEEGLTEPTESLTKKEISALLLIERQQRARVQSKTVAPPTNEFVPVVPDRVLENLQPVLARRGYAREVVAREGALLGVNTRGLVAIAERLEAEARIVQAEQTLMRREQELESLRAELSRLRAVVTDDGDAQVLELTDKVAQ